ncbi:MAG: hypothetical protein U9Q85_02920 [Patescibacteria group bacterium]|nr:hypothetical protein [Patescibacteria group bacterium]
MREILSLSMPGKTIKEIKNRVKKRGYKSISSYIKYLLEMDGDDNIISEDSLAKMIKKARQEYKKGTLIKANSIADLL